MSLFVPVATAAAVALHLSTDCRVMASELTPNVSLREAAFLQPPNLATFILGQVMVAARHRRISFYKILAIAWPARKEERSSRCRFRWCTSEWHGGRNVGRDGDVYIAADNKIWKKVQERWVLRRDLTGDKGDKGDKGDTGNKGDKGDKGDDGDRGPQGEVGLKGDKGDKGDTGNQGPRGEAGPRGLGGWLEHPNSPMTMNSGQDKIFSNIPAGTKHIKLVFADLSLTGAQNILVRLGDAGQSGEKTRDNMMGF